MEFFFINIFGFHCLLVLCYVSQMKQIPIQSKPFPNSNEAQHRFFFCNFLCACECVGCEVHFLFSISIVDTEKWTKNKNSWLWQALYETCMNGMNGYMSKKSNFSSILMDHSKMMISYESLLPMVSHGPNDEHTNLKSKFKTPIKYSTIVKNIQISWCWRLMIELWD